MIRVSVKNPPVCSLGGVILEDPLANKALDADEICLRLSVARVRDRSGTRCLLQ